jgi:hypothetical protein
VLKKERGLFEKSRKLDELEGWQGVMLSTGDTRIIERVCTMLIEMLALPVFSHT